MLNEIEILSLCSTCDLAPGCTFVRDKDKRPPNLFCEEFTCDNSRPTKKVIRNNPNVSAVIKDNPSKLKGLCSDCENRNFCTFPKLEGGIWHCEEYQ